MYIEISLRKKLVFMGTELEKNFMSQRVSGTYIIACEKGRLAGDAFSNSTSIMDNRSSTTYLTVAAVTVAAGLAAYAVYFDYKRRNDVEFRKQLSKLFVTSYPLPC